MNTLFRLLISVITFGLLAACTTPASIPTSIPLVPSIQMPVVAPATTATSIPSTVLPIQPTERFTEPTPTGTLAASASPAMKPGEYENSIAVGALTRDYILHVPPSYDGSKGMPLVFVMHGLGGSNKAIEETTGMSVKADQESFVAIYPNGTGNPRGFNIGVTGKQSQVDDVSFVRALIDKMEKDLRVDSKRIYVSGLSNGGFMTYRLGAELSDRLAAIAVAEGAIGTSRSDGSALTISNPVNPVPVIAFHGKQDTVIPYDGGPGIDGLHYLPVADSIGFWVKQDACAAAPQTTTLQNGNVIEDDYANCKGGTEVTLYTIGNGKHDWPSATLPNQISATDVIWQFFTRHPKP